MSVTSFQDILNFRFTPKTNELKVLIDFDSFEAKSLENAFNIATQDSQLKFLKQFILYIESFIKNKETSIAGLANLNIEEIYFSLTMEENQIRMWYGQHGWQVDSRHVDSGKTSPLLNLTLRGDCSRNHNPYIQLIESLGYSYLDSSSGYYKYTKES
jgi:hypothetical protein